MKQRITVEQLNELTDEQVKKLSEWWKDHLPLLNIGQLIEYLTQTEKPLIESSLAGWRVWHQGEHYSKVELCDALWEAVKQCL